MARRPSEPLPEFITPQEAAAALKCGGNKARRIIRKLPGAIEIAEARPGRRVYRIWRAPRAAFEAYMAGRVS